MERAGGLSPHTSPFTTVADVGNLLVSTGFGLPTVDSDALTVEYPDAAAVIRHLRCMGDGHVAMQRRLGIHTDVVLGGIAAYQGMYGQSDGSVPVTYNVIYLIGWAPASSQPKPLRRGSVPKGFGARGHGPPPELGGQTQA